MNGLDKLDLNESVKSSEQTGSSDKDSEQSVEYSPILIGAGDINMAQDKIDEERRKIVELSNESVLHGYDLAIELLKKAEETHSVELLSDNRKIIELGLKNTISERIK